MKRVNCLKRKRRKLQIIRIEWDNLAARSLYSYLIRFFDSLEFMSDKMINW